MIYCQQDFLMLELKTDDELREEIVQAKKDYEGVQSYFKQMEDETDSPFPSCLPNLDILFTQLKNIEGYIRKAENLLNTYDSGQYVTRAQKRRETNLEAKRVVKRNKRIRMIGVD